MPSFGTKSKSLLDLEVDGIVLDENIKAVMYRAIQDYDFTVLYTIRTAKEQFELFKKGRKKVNGKWVIVDRKKVVTYKDGYDKKSKHQLGKAIDIVFWQDSPPFIEWDNHKANYFLMGYILGIAEMMKQYGEIDVDIISGGNWDDDEDLDDQSFFDVFHFEVK